MDEWDAPNKQYASPKAGEPPLHRAARFGDHEEIRRLVAAGADVDAVFDGASDDDWDEVPATPLMVAAGTGDGATAETVKLLLELGADAARVVDDETAATAAFKGLGWGYKPGGDAARALVLRSAGSPLPTEPEERNRLLCRAARSGDPERLSMLLGLGFSAGGHWDADRARESHGWIAEQMQADRRALPDAFQVPGDMREQVDVQMREFDRDMRERMSSAPSSYEIPLFQAAESGNAECIRLLLDAGADARVRDSSKQTAMYSVGSVEAARTLKEAGVPVEDQDHSGWSPLVCAVSLDGGPVERVAALLAAGADVNGTHDRGYTVFMSAVGSGRRPEVLRMLIAAGANPHAVSELGYNAFHAAIDVNFEANAEESVRGTLGYLKELGVNIEQRNGAGLTPLGRAIQDGTGLEARVLCELGADANEVCPKHECGGEECARVECPLLFHAIAGIGVHKEEKAEALLRGGADVTAVDGEGFNSLAHAVSALCRDAADYEASFQAFYAGLNKLRFTGGLPPTRNEFVEAAKPVLRAFVEEFASGIPVQNTSKYGAVWREERVSCIVVLCAYEGWARHERRQAAEGSDGDR